MPWYKGPTITEQMDLFPQPELPTNLPMRMPIQDVYEITGIGTVPVIITEISSLASQPRQFVVVTE